MKYIEVSKNCFPTNHIPLSLKMMIPQLFDSVSPLIKQVILSMNWHIFNSGGIAFLCFLEVVMLIYKVNVVKWRVRDTSNLSSVT